MEVVSKAGVRLILDAGSGIRDLGASLLSKLPVEVHLLFTHYHWDHILGFPFFVPAFIPNNKLHIYGQRKGALDVKQILSNLMSAPNFPVPLAVMASKMEFYDLEEEGTLTIGDLKVTYGPLFHPNGVVGFRIQNGDRIFTFLTDIEHESETENARSPLDLSMDAHSIAYDCQYTPEQYPQRIKWGHSTWSSALRLAIEAKVPQVLMIHHDPAHNDAQIRSILSAAREGAKDSGVHFEAVYEGMEVEV